MPRLESNRLAAKRAYYRRLDKVAAMQQENKTLQDACEEQKNRVNVYEILVRRSGNAAAPPPRASCLASQPCHTIPRCSDIRADSHACS
jgi:hypothetical protein